MFKNSFGKKQINSDVVDKYTNNYLVLIILF